MEARLRLWKKMNNKKRELGQFHTRNADYILQSLISVIPENAVVVDPFAGEKDLLNYVGKNLEKITALAYDMEPMDDSVERRDSLENPIDYNGKWVVTNPPYLAKNRAVNKRHFLKYGADDLYKCSLRMLAGHDGNSVCEGGFLIVPLNFFCDRDDATRKLFLSKYRICSLNIFEEQVFEDTSYTVCAFSFKREDNETQNIEACFFPSKERQEFSVSAEHGYRIGHDFRRMIEIDEPAIKVGRLVKDKEIPEGWHITNLFFRAIDTGRMNGRIGLQLRYEPLYAKESDKTFVTIICSKKLSREQEESIVVRFNRCLERNRKAFHSLFLTNFRNATKDYARKRLDFKTAYKLIQKLCSYEAHATPVSVDWAKLRAAETKTSTKSEQSAYWRQSRNHTHHPESEHIWIKPSKRIESSTDCRSDANNCLGSDYKWTKKGWRKISEREIQAKIRRDAEAAANAWKYDGEANPGDMFCWVGPYSYERKLKTGKVITVNVRGHWRRRRLSAAMREEMSQRISAN